MEQKETALRTVLTDLATRIDSDPSIFATREYPKLAKRRQELESVVELFNDRKVLHKRAAEAKELAAGEDAELAELAQIELDEIAEAIARNEESLRDALTPKDPNDDRDVVIEIRAAAGGDEASLFAADLYRMYVRWAEQHRYKVELIDEAPSEVGGFKEIIFGVHGVDIYKQLKFEAGVHRVQRIPST